MLINRVIAKCYCPWSMVGQHAALIGLGKTGGIITDISTVIGWSVKRDIIVEMRICLARSRYLRHGQLDALITGLLLTDNNDNYHNSDKLLQNAITSWAVNAGRVMWCNMNWNIACIFFSPCVTTGELVGGFRQKSAGGSIPQVQWIAVWYILYTYTMRTLKLVIKQMNAGEYWCISSN